MIRRVNADNHRGQEDKTFQQQAGYMRAMIFSHMKDQKSCKRSGSIYAQERPAECHQVFVTALIALDPHKSVDGFILRLLKLCVTHLLKKFTLRAASS